MDSNTLNLSPVLIPVRKVFGGVTATCFSPLLQESSSLLSLLVNPLALHLLVVASESSVVCCYDRAEDVIKSDGIF